MSEITLDQIENWKRDSDILDRVKKAVETDLNKPWYTEELKRPSLISIGSLAKRWDLNKQTLWRKAKAGEIPAKQMGDTNHWYVDMNWVLKEEKIET